MRILYINTIDTKGGAAKVAYSLKTEMIKRGHLASMFVKLKYSNDPDVTEMRWPNPVSAVVKKITGKDIGSVIHNKIRPWLANDIQWFKTKKLLQTNEFKQADIIHCHNLHGNYFNLSMLKQMSELKPIIWTLHDMWAITPHCAHALDGRVRDGFFECPSLDSYQALAWNNEAYLRTQKRNLYNAAKFTLVTPCKWLADKVGKSVLKDKPIELIYNGIDTTTFKTANKKAARECLGLPVDKQIILFVSAIGQNKEKGWEQIERMMERYKNNKKVLFVSVGAHAQKSNLQKENACMSIGFVSDDRKLAEYYAAADLFLFPSLAETFPLVVLEAMSAGLPVVSFDVGGVKEAIQHKESGYIAHYLDQDDLVSGVEYVLSRNTAQYDTLSKNARASVESHFTNNVMVGQYISLYQKLLADRQPSIHK